MPCASPRLTRLETRSMEFNGVASTTGLLIDNRHCEHEIKLCDSTVLWVIDDPFERSRGSSSEL